jgi:tripartite-type tricarboxylate transporter receptor subunit TctC
MVVAPAGTPAAMIDKLNSTLNQALNLPALKERMVNEAYDPAPSTPQQARELLENDMAKWSKLIAAAGIKVD